MHIDLVTLHRAWNPRSAPGQHHIRETRDGPTLDAHEVGVSIRARIADLEPPYMIADIDAPHDARCMEVGEIAKQRRAIAEARISTL